MQLARAEQMQRLDAATINDLGIPGAVLMENAGRGTVAVMAARYGILTGRTVAIFCGPGNNGGDGLVIARHLHQQNARPLVFLLVPAEKMRGDAGRNLAVVQNLPIPVTTLRQDADLAALPGCDLVVDAIFGTGLKRPVDGLFAVAIEHINRMRKPVVAVDIPSGLDSDSGQPLGACVHADCTATYGLAKPGHWIEPGRHLTGQLTVVDIGIPPELVAAAGLDLELLAAEDIRGRLGRRQPDSHKGTYGHLLVAAGSTGKTGAALLAARGALRSGAGLVTLAVPADCNQIFETALAEAMTVPLPHSSGHLNDSDLDLLRATLANKTAVALGPGIGLDPSTARLVTALYRESPLAMVVDADALNILAEAKNLIRDAAGPRILTPHPGEMARLAGISSREVQHNRLAVTRDFASRHRVFVVLKGAATLIAAPDGRVAINPTGNPGMATGGMGDVLTGLIGSLLAQRRPPWQAACAGVYLHGLAADRLAVQQSMGGYLASEVADELPLALHYLMHKGD